MTAVIKPTKPQFDYITSTAQYPAMVAGFGAGKSEAAIKRSIIGKLKYPSCNRGFYLPTYDLVRTIAFPRFEQALEELGIPYRLYKSPLNYIEFAGAGKIIFRSMDTPARLIGYEHADADCDELDTLKPDDAEEVWRRILSRNRQKKPDGSPNTIGVTTTPEGFRFVYKAWKQERRNGYEIIQAPTYSNPHLPDGYIQSLRDIYPPQLLQAYLDGEFVNLTSGSVYYNFDRHLSGSSEEIQQGEQLHIGIDFNVANMSAIIHVLRDGKLHAVSELSGVFDTPDMVRIIKERYVGHNIKVYPDASGGNRKSVDALRTDLMLLEQAGFRLVVDSTNPPVRSRVTSFNAALMNASGDRRYFVNVKKCPELAKCLEQQAYDKNGEPDKKQGLDHLPDAAGYCVYQLLPVVRPVVKGVRFG